MDDMIDIRPNRHGQSQSLCVTRLTVSLYYRFIKLACRAHQQMVLLLLKTAPSIGEPHELTSALTEIPIYNKP